MCITQYVISVSTYPIIHLCFSPDPVDN